MRLNLSQVLRYGVFLAYPAIYLLWIEQVNRTWVRLG